MSTPVEIAAAQAEAARVARMSYGKLVAFLSARDRDVAGAEDALSEAFAAALEDWPERGPPRNPEAWLLVAARRKLRDAARRRRVAEAAQGEIVGRIEEGLDDAGASAAIPDRRLALMFVCAHPAIEPGVRAPLMLQTILGLDASAIASAFLVSPAAMGQRLSRAKAKIRLAGVPFRIPEPEEWPSRMSAVLEAIYGAFSHGWSEAFADDPRGRDLTREAIWLGRLVVSLAPGDAEALGLLALMLYCEARRAARRDPGGRYIPLSDQFTDLWDERAIAEAETCLGAAARLRRPQRFQIEAAIQSAHVARRLTGFTDWAAITTLYDALLSMTQSSVVAVNRAVALANAFTAEVGLAALRDAGAHGRLDAFQSFWAAKAELEARSGDPEADSSYERAMGLASDPAERAFLSERRAAAKAAPRLPARPRL